MSRNFLVQATAYLILKSVYHLQRSDLRRELTLYVIEGLAEKAWGSKTSLSPCLENGNLVLDRCLS